MSYSSPISDPQPPSPPRYEVLRRRVPAHSLVNPQAVSLDSYSLEELRARGIGLSALVVYRALLVRRDNPNGPVETQCAHRMWETFASIAKRTKLTYKQVEYGFNQLKKVGIIVPIRWVWIDPKNPEYHYFVLGIVKDQKIRIPLETELYLQTHPSVQAPSTRAGGRPYGVRNRKSSLRLKRVGACKQYSLAGAWYPSYSSLKDIDTIRSIVSSKTHKKHTKVSEDGIPVLASARTAPSGACTILRSQREKVVERLPPPPPSRKEATSGVGNCSQHLVSEIVANSPNVQKKVSYLSRAVGLGGIPYKPPTIFDDASYKNNGDRICYSPFINAGKSPHHVTSGKIPLSPKISPVASDVEKAKILAKCYRGYNKFVTKKACHTFSRGDITQSKYFKRLVDAADKMIELDIRPMLWVKFSLDTWQYEDKNTGFPPITYAFCAARIEKLYYLFEEFVDDTHYAIPTPKVSALRDLYTAYTTATSWLRSHEGSQEATNEYMNLHFPGTAWIELVRKAQHEMARRLHDYEQRVNDFEYVWGVVSGQ